MSLPSTGRGARRPTCTNGSPPATGRTPRWKHPRRRIPADRERPEDTRPVRQLRASRRQTRIRRRRRSPCRSPSRPSRRTGRSSGGPATGRSTRSPPTSPVSCHGTPGNAPTRCRRTSHGPTSTSAPENIQSCQAIFNLEPSYATLFAWRVITGGMQRPVRGIIDGTRPGCSTWCADTGNLLVVFVSFTADHDMADAITCTKPGMTFTRRHTQHKAGSSWGQGAIFTGIVPAALGGERSRRPVHCRLARPHHRDRSTIVYEVTNPGDGGARRRRRSRHPHRRFGRRPGHGHPVRRPRSDVGRARVAVDDRRRRPTVMVPRPAATTTSRSSSTRTRTAPTSTPSPAPRSKPRRPIRSSTGTTSTSAPPPPTRGWRWPSRSSPAPTSSYHSDADAALVVGGLTDAFNGPIYSAEAVTGLDPNIGDLCGRSTRRRGAALMAFFASDPDVVVAGDGGPAPRPPRRHLPAGLGRIRSTGPR